MKLRLVAVADTHLFETDLGELPAGDMLVHAGDLLRAGDLEELERGANWLRRQPHPHKIFVAGNHDRCFEQEELRARAIDLLGPDIIYLQDSGVELFGLRFWGSPWQPAYNDWAFNLPRGDALAEKWAQIPADIDILITHGPPAGIGDATSVHGRHGCEALRERVAEVRPLVHLFGHIHQDGGVFEADGTVFVNATTWECERDATVIEVDVSTRLVRTISCPAAHGRRG